MIGTDTRLEQRPVVLSELLPAFARVGEQCAKGDLVGIETKEQLVRAAASELLSPEEVDTVDAGRAKLYLKSGDAVTMNELEKDDVVFVDCGPRRTVRT